MKSKSPLNVYVRRARALGVLLACALAACSTTREGPSVSDTTTNWLHACKRNADCRGESSCIAGTCTITCSPQVEAACSSLPVEAECVERSDGPAYCDLPCRFDRACDDLGENYACLQGFCRPERAITQEERERAMDARVPQSNESASLFDRSPVILVDSGVPGDIVLATDSGQGQVDSQIVCPSADAGFAVSVTWQPPPWEPFVSDAGRDERFRIVKDTFVGRWHGLATPYFELYKPYLVDLEFKADGQYGGRCTEIPDYCCRAFHDGTSLDTPLKQYRLLDAQASGYLIGDIDIVNSVGDGFEVIGIGGKLSYIERDRSGNGLRFVYGDSSPRVRFDLRRVEKQ